jgi:mitochondrial chaperone BCS1
MGEGTKKALDYIPWTGSFLFWYQGQPISYRNTLVEAGFRREEQISLTCLGRSSRVLRALMDECLREYLARSERKTAIFEHREDRWIRMGSRNTRPLSTIIVNEKVKKSMVDDVKEFLEPVSRLWYTKKSMAYRRGYLLSGPPGTGKSSLCFSVAGEFDLDIYIVSIPSVSDRYLRDLFDKLPEKCMVLLEDVDAAGISRLNTESDDFKQSTGLLKPGQTLTLSGLLNRLDGVSSPEGRVVVMTTNHVEKLDEALTRPGRVDRKIEFELADKDVISSLFSYVYEEPDGDEDAGGSLDIKGQATRFAESVPPSMFSQAEVLSYLMQYKDRPDEALRDCQAWVDAALQSKATLKRGNSWNHCN